MTVYNFIVIEMTKGSDWVSLTYRLVGSSNTLSTIKLDQLDIRDLMTNKHNTKDMMREYSRGLKKHCFVESSIVGDSGDCDIVYYPPDTN